MTDGANGEIHHRMTRRLADWDYRQRAIYSIVETFADRSRQWMGALARDKFAKNCDSSVAGHSCPAIWYHGKAPVGIDKVAEKAVDAQAPV